MYTKPLICLLVVFVERVLKTYGLIMLYPSYLSGKSGQIGFPGILPDVFSD